MVKTTNTAPMESVKTLTKLTWWPTPQDYNEAVQNPHVNFLDAELQASSIFVGSLGLPRPVCGAFASVYRVRCEDKEFAVRCFLRNISDQETRYGLISEFVQSDDLPYTVGFEFDPRGIKIRNDWFPVLKMDWVAGQTLEQFVIANLSNRECLKVLANKFLLMCDHLRESGVAHGDFQHGNILVVGGGELRLVDYDGMFVPSMAGLKANELGHRNYQHPERNGNHFGPYLDNFSAWVVYASLKILSIDSSLFNQLGGGDDCLLFKKTDFLNPLQSQRFAILEAHSNEEIRNLAQVVRANLERTPEYVPALKAVLPVVHLPSLQVKPTMAPTASTSMQMGLPEWLQAELTQKANLPDWMSQEGGHFVEPVIKEVQLKIDHAVVEAELRELQINAFNAASSPRKVQTTNVDLYGNPVLLANFAIASAAITVLSGRVLGTAICLVCLALIAIAYWCLSRPPLDRRLVREGKATRGTLLAAEESSYTYQFSTTDGLVRCVRYGVPSDVIAKLKAGPQQVIVIYDENDPRHSSVIYSISRLTAVY